jgi:FkbM family methyltransferase
MVADAVAFEHTPNMGTLNSIKRLSIKRIAGRLSANKLVHSVARATLPSRLKHRLPALGRSADYVSGSLRVSLLDPYRDQVAKDLYWGKGQPTSPADRHVLRYIERMALHSDIFLDVGSYSGLFAILAAKANPGIGSIAYEILPENYSAIARNITANGVDVEAKLLGLSDQPGELFMPEDYGSLSHPSSVSLSASYERGVAVPIGTLDAEGYAGRILIKIDVEGWELEVLRGGIETLKAYQPNIICEVLRHSSQTPAISALLRPLGYRFFLSTRDGFKEQSELVPNPDPMLRDWLFTTGTP